MSSSRYDAGYSQALELKDGRVLDLYERRGSAPAKGGGSAALRSGTRTINGVSWTWAVLQNGATTLSATTQGTYVELALPGGEDQVDSLASVAGSLRPVESLFRPPAAVICAALHVGLGGTRVAAAFDSTADAVTAWHETPTSPDGPRPVSEWRLHPSSEPVAVCYLDGDFGPPRGPLRPGTTASPLPNYDRVVYAVGVDRRPIPITFGWQDRVPVREPARAAPEPTPRTTLPGAPSSVLGAFFDVPPPFPGYQWTRNGQPAVRGYELTTAAGPAHCGWESATFLTIGWPVGTVSSTAAQARQYIRDPRGLFSGTAFRRPLDLRATLPADAKPTGYRYGPLEIYLSPTDQDDAIYIVGPGGAERWPRSDPMTGCV